MYVLFAIVSAISAGAVSVTAKAGLNKVNSNLVTFLRTSVVFVFTFIMVLITASLFDIKKMTYIEWLYIIGSGLATGLSWLCYFKALKLADVNKVVPIDKMSSILTMILAITIFGEKFWWLTFVSMFLMVTGTLLLVIKIKKKEIEVPNTDASNTAIIKSIQQQQNTKFKLSWIFFAIMSLIFASTTSILAKIGMQAISSHLGTFLRTAVVLIFAFFIVLFQKQLREIKVINLKNWLLIVASGLLTGISWITYFYAIQIGIVSVIAPIDRLSMVISILLAFFFFKEKITLRGWIGLMILVLGTMLLLVPIVN